MKNTFSRAQVNLFDEIIVDNFAGGGGASTGIELAAGRPVSIAINHDEAAVLLHQTNHKFTEHYIESVWDVDPVEVCAGRPVGLAWFSPDCKHFSKAKGAALVSRKIRGLAWIVLRWAALVRPRVIMVENVEEFITWGPVRKGKPVRKKSGQTFRQWVKQIRDLGYTVEWRNLVAADYGAPTIRKRFVCVARCDGKPIRWPEPTHAPADSPDVRKGKLLPWRSAAEIIDWDIPAYSIFATKEEIKEKYGVNAVRPLADNTLRRVIRGVDKFTIKSGKPFIVECNHGGDGHTRGADEPVNTVTRKYTGGICEPVMVPVTFPNTSGSVGGSADQPVHTITTDGKQVFSAANLIQYHTEQSEHVRANGLGNPIPTVDASNRYGLISGQLVEYYGNGIPLDIEQPMHTVTGHDREALVSAHIQKYFDGAYKGCGDSAEAPLSTVTALPRHGLCAAHVVEFKGQDIGQSADTPLRTITASAGEFAVCHTVLAKHDGRDLRHWTEIRELLNRYCGYTLEEDDVILLVIGGVAYYIADITLRMLTPRELYNAMGFPDDYVIDTDFRGNPYPKSQQVARCGNAVCPPLASAMVRANFPEWAVKGVERMEQFNELVGVTV